MQREQYLEKLISKINNGRIKVITGLRRCGKSYLLFDLFIPWLISQGINKKNIISINFENVEYLDFLEPKKLYSYILSQINDDSNYYIIIDEIQTLNGYESVLNSLNNNKHFDVYVTGSNSKLLSSEISTSLRGRDDQVKVHPLTFKEICQANNQADINKLFDDYIIYGGMPYLQSIKNNSDKQEYLKDLFNLIYIKDINERHQVNRIDILESIIDTISSQVGSYTSIRKIENTLNSKGIKVSDDTIASYVSYLVESFLFKKVTRWDIKGKDYLAGIFKYYCVDLGLRNARLNFRQIEINHLMENVIYNELLARNYIVDIGIIYSSDKKSYEVDFIARKGPKQFYLQSTFSLYSEDKINQEISSFRKINDGFRKIIITKETSPFTTLENGYERINIIDFLLNEDYLK